MKIDFKEVDTEKFFIKPYDFHGEEVYLISPIEKVGSWDEETGMVVSPEVWTEDNLHFRSSVWNKDGELISASFPKFFNWNEKPNLTGYPHPKDKYISVLEKIDGSCLIVSYYKGNIMVRTRGTVDASKLDKNGDEIAYLKEKYPSVFDVNNGFFQHEYNKKISLIFEWVSPKNKIIISYEESDIILIGAILHDDYMLYTQAILDFFAKDVLHVKRPKVYKYDSMDELLADVELWENAEGVCVYYNNWQNIRKVKSAWYNNLHRGMSGMTSPRRIINMWVDYKYPSKNDFFSILEASYDYEVASLSMPLLDLLDKSVDIYTGKYTAAILDHKDNILGLDKMDAVRYIKSLPDKFDQAVMFAYMKEQAPNEHFMKMNVKEIFKELVKNEK